MNNTYINNWETVKNRFEQWWNCEDGIHPLEKPLMRIVAPGKTGKTVPLKELKEAKELYLDIPYIVQKYRNFCETHYFLADAFPSLAIDLGPGSLSLYVGGEADFSWDSVWYNEKFESAEEFKTLHYDEENHWWKKHKDMMQEAAALSKGDFYVGIPDIIENLDILSALRGPQNLCFDMIDEPELVSDGVNIIDDLYFNYYDYCYNQLKDNDNSSAYTVFDIVGKGRVAKIQCDFSALISPDAFREYVVPSLTKQCKKLDRSMYHLDGPDAIRHVPALMEIKELNALQWTCGAGKPDGGSSDWYSIYDQVRGAGKSLWISLHDGSPAEQAEKAKQLVKRYGHEGLYFLFPTFPDLAQAKKMAALFD
jgi:5-methyltetrahydrofolate--homocysteine methyltransferase